MEQVYGIHAVDTLLRREPGSIQCLWVQAGRQDKRMSALLDLAANQGVAVHTIARADLDQKVPGRHQGVIADVHRTTRQWDEAALYQLLDDLGRPALVLVLDGVTDPHNLGACLRSADAAGVDAVIVPKDKSADLNPTVRKVACGAAEVVPFVRVTNLARTLEGLKERGIWLYGTAGEADTLLYDADLSGPVAIVMGAEGAGLRRLTREKCDHLVKLPMAGEVSSLNVSVATGICLFEAVRQRQ
ncbi:MAG: 23S rRNA (guanosine(2251)-2'-O)-methyltransferase RlmB [Halieaceae bacterium]|nr:23S rRNA (guanosine(2251)-2'-O)-methyltransferase RlmB [Halieaceae bacterium]